MKDEEDEELYDLVNTFKDSFESFIRRSHSQNYQKKIDFIVREFSKMKSAHFERDEEQKQINSKIVQSLHTISQIQEKCFDLVYKSEDDYFKDFDELKLCMQTQKDISQSLLDLVTLQQDNKQISKRVRFEEPEPDLTSINKRISLIEDSIKMLKQNLEHERRCSEDIRKEIWSCALKTEENVLRKVEKYIDEEIMALLKSHADKHTNKETVLVSTENEGVEKKSNRDNSVADQVEKTRKRVAELEKKWSTQRSLPAPPPFPPPNMNSQ